MHELSRVTTAPRSAKCPQCGGESGFDPRQLKPVCEWCGAVLVASPDSAKSRPEEIAPLQLEAAAARSAIELWMKQPSDKVPQDFAKRAKILTVAAAFYPYYLFSGVYSGWRGSSTISGGFSEMINASGDLLAIRVQAPVYQFFAPPSDDVSLEDLAARIMSELVEERRITAHTDFCRHIIRKTTAAPLQEFSEEQLEGLIEHTFTEPFEVAESRLKQSLAERTKLKDIFFQELKTRRILWPFYVAEISCLGFKYYCFIDGSSPQADYIGGYKPIDPTLQTSSIEMIRKTDPADFIELFTSSNSSVHTFTGNEAIEQMKEVRSLMNSLSNSPKDMKPQLTFGVKKGCFIATAAYGSEWANEVAVLRNFRDLVLAKHASGRVFISIYYRLSPPIARAIESSQAARASTRYLLTPLIHYCRKHVN